MKRIQAVLFALALLASGAAFADVTVPHLDVGKGGHCVNDPKFMKLNHGDLLMHQRTITVHQGVRGRYSLEKCVNCHASRVNNSVLGTDRNFCQGCHAYAAVKIDCFECHSSRPETVSETLTEIAK